MRAFTDADEVQSNSGTTLSASTQDMTLPAAVAEGDTGLVVVYTAGVMTSPEDWDPIITDPLHLFSMFLRAGCTGGETSWTFGSSGGAWAWLIGEWSNMSSVPVLSVGAASGSTGDTSLSTGSSGTSDTQFVMAVAAFALTQGGAGGSVWPSVSYGSGFTETDSVQVGDGTTSGDALVKVARLYGADSDTGPWSCTATFTGTLTGKTPSALLGVFRAEETMLPPLVLVS
jgi:hypothetical protein